MLKEFTEKKLRGLSLEKLTLEVIGVDRPLPRSFLASSERAMRVWFANRCAAHASPPTCRRIADIIVRRFHLHHVA